MSNIEVRVKLEANLKKEADFLFKNMGMTTSEAIRVFLQQSVNSRGLPFRPHMKEPRPETIRAFNEKIENMAEYDLAEFANLIKEYEREED